MENPKRARAYTSCGPSHTVVTHKNVQNLAISLGGASFERPSPMLAAHDRPVVLAGSFIG